MESEITFLVEESVEGGYMAQALGHSIFTEATSLEELRSVIADAVRSNFAEGERPKAIRLHFVKEETSS